MDKDIKEPIAPEDSQEMLVEGESEVDQGLQTTLEKEPNQTEAQRQDIRTQLEAVDLDDSLKLQAQSDADSMQAQDAKKIIKNLLTIAKTKGLVFAVNVAKKINDPYILDSFHDELVKEGYYKDFIK